VIRLKEPRYLIAIVPMLALAVATFVDWDDVAKRLVLIAGAALQRPSAASVP
jgi:hypothetical protein